MPPQMMAERWNLDRRTLDEYALRSHELTAQAIDAGAFDSQFAPIEGHLGADEGLRRGESVDKLATLKVPFKAALQLYAGNHPEI